MLTILAVRPGLAMRIAGLTLMLLSTSTAFATERLLMVGAAETVKISPGGIEFEARIDTGANTSSINAQRVRPFQRSGKQWVRFDLEGKRGQRISFEREVVRSVLIKQFGTASKRRFVVLVGICLGSFYKNAQVTLQDRSRRKYPILIGRRLMAGSISVDPGREHVVKPTCTMTR